MEGKMTVPSTEPGILIVDALPLRSLGLSSILGRLDRSSVPSKFRLIVHTPDQAEQWIAADADCEMLIYNAGGASIADRANLQRIKVLRALAPDAPLVIFSERESREEIISALNVGAQGLLYAGTNAELALRAFSVILNGGSYFPSAMRPKRTDAAQRRPVVDYDPVPSCGIGGGNGGGGNGGAEDLEDAGSRNRNLTARQNAVLELPWRLQQGHCTPAGDEGRNRQSSCSAAPAQVRSDEPHAGRRCLRERRQVIGTR
jgi:DNA-binding NarL/FixJ family response regulator